MKNPIDIWDEVGNIPLDEFPNVLAKLFTFYEGKLQQDPDNQEAVNFFINLDNSITQTLECNLNRR